jgi:hypothetical protein
VYLSRDFLLHSGGKINHEGKGGRSDETRSGEPIFFAGKERPASLPSSGQAEGEPYKGTLAEWKRKTLRRAYYCRRAIGLVGLSVLDEATGGIGAATPAVCEPRPSWFRVLASSLPLGFNPWASWYFFMAATVPSSHFPLGEPAYEPSFARAC